ncbi:MAG TPA: hypothetical protein VGQ96_05645 [Candidatus Eremiobacteraceae bacterium]|nr:hypothetical protein [Candidatus Eremiobacteraceae bacterium]
MLYGKSMPLIKSLFGLALAACLVTAIGLAGLAAPSPSPSPSPNVDTIIEMVLHRNPGLRSYQAHAQLDVRQVNFPYLHPVLDGKVYYNSPGYTVYDFPHTPSYLQGITKVEGAVGMATRWRHCYNITLEVRPDVYVLHMVPKIRGEVSEMVVHIDKKSGNQLFFDWSYHNVGDSVQLWQTYSMVGGYDVVTAQAADIHKHHIRAKAVGNFDSFQFNVPVPTPTPTPTDPLHQCDN